MKDLILLAISLFFLAFGERLLVTAGVYNLQPSPIRTCRDTSECGEDSCCRDANGNVLNGLSFGPIELPGSEREGICGNKAGKNGTICNSYCGCEPGLTCYRIMTGRCCVPSRCYDSEWVRQEEEKWRNCFPPNCHFPA